MNKKVWFILLVAAVGILLIWGSWEAHRYLFVLGLSPFVGLIAAPALLIGLIVLVVVATRWLRRRAGFMPEDWFWAAFTGWALGAIYCSVTGSLSTIDIQLHDTYFVITHHYICLWLAVVFGVFGLIYHYNRRMGRVLGMIHFWMTFLAAPLFIWAAPWVEGMPVRYTDYNRWISFSQYGAIERLFLWLLAPGLIAQVVFVVNVIYSMTGRVKSVD